MGNQFESGDQFKSQEKRAAAALEKLDAMADGKDDTDDKSAKQSTANALIELAVEHCDLFHDERSDGYVVTTRNKTRRTLKLRGREFRRWLAGTYYEDTKRAANNEAISTALSVLEAKATFDGRMLELSNRFAMRKGVIYIDMADEEWRVIKITAQGWEVMSKPPVLFRRYSHQKALPDPVKGGKLSGIHAHLSIKSDDDKLLVEASLVACALPNMERKSCPKNHTNVRAATLPLLRSSGRGTVIARAARAKASVSSPYNSSDAFGQKGRSWCATLLRSSTCRSCKLLMCRASKRLCGKSS